jgi:hypothetical protein
LGNKKSCAKAVFYTGFYIKNVLPKEKVALLYVFKMAYKVELLAFIVNMKNVEVACGDK